MNCPGGIYELSRGNFCVSFLQPLVWNSPLVCAIQREGFEFHIACTLSSIITIHLVLTCKIFTMVSLQHYM